MPKRVAVSYELGQIRALLQEKGYEVVDLEVGEKALPKVDAVVVSGLSENLLGREDRLTGAPVIDARGRQAEEVLWDLGKRLK
ncbi:MAG: YkuS family protein [Bacillota bacterium]|nr:YkuS family protein [Bacillota bacterium]